MKCFWEELRKYMTITIFKQNLPPNTSSDNQVNTRLQVKRGYCGHGTTAFMFILCGVYICFFTVLACFVAKNIWKSWFDYIYFEIFQKIDVNNNSILFLSLFFSLSYHRTIAFGSMERWRDAVMTMVQWRWRDGMNIALAMVRRHNDGDAIELWQWSDDLSRHRYCDIAPSLFRHRIIALSAF